MKGLQIWAYSKCRSTLAFYEGLAEAYNVPVRICIVKVSGETRKDLGWNDEEFSHLEIVPVGNNFERASKHLLAYKDWHQLFGAYQRFSAIQSIILKAKAIGCEVGVCSEAPLNMFESLPKRVLKKIYLDYILKHRVIKLVNASSFIINFSGEDTLSLTKLGWRDEQIIPSGYVSSPLEGSNFSERTSYHYKNFHIACSGIHTWHRGQDTLVDALAILKNWGLNFSATITQEGPTSKYLKDKIKEKDLPVDMPGRLSMDDLISLYQNCSVYVGSGREEPWGLRVNDALHAGAPLVISTGMGAKKIINDHFCGKTFIAGDAVDLAWKLRKLMEDKEEYLKCASAVAHASRELLPVFSSKQIAEILSASFKGWELAQFHKD